MKLAPLVAAAALSLAACDQPTTPTAASAPSPRAPRATLTAADGEVVMSELHNPRGLTFGPDGALYVAEAGTGGAGPCLIVVATQYCYGPTGSVSRLWHGAQE